MDNDQSNLFVLSDENRPFDVKSTYTIRFGDVGELAFHDGILTFTGQLDESAEAFVHALGNALSERITELEAAIHNIIEAVNSDLLIDSTWGRDDVDGFYRAVDRAAALLIKDKPRRE